MHEPAHGSLASRLSTPIAVPALEGAGEAQHFDFPVHDTGYWLICNATDGEQKTFNKILNFKTTLLSYKLNTDYIEDTLVDLKACLDSDKYPSSGQDCDNCRWYNEKKKLGDTIRSNAEKNQKEKE